MVSHGIQSASLQAWVACAHLEETGPGALAGGGNTALGIFGRHDDF